MGNVMSTNINSVDDPIRETVYFVRGDTFLLQFSYEIGSSLATVVPVSVAGETWVFTVRSEVDDSVILSGTSVGSAGIELNADGVVGRVRLKKLPADTATMPIGTKHKFDIQRTTADGFVETLWLSDFVVREDQSR